jgi:hypothetical protein
MLTPTAHLAPVQQCYPQTVIARADLLGIAPSELLHKTLPEVQALVKKRYHLLCFIKHPDTRHHTKRRGAWKRSPSKGFQELTALYQWFMALTEEDILREKRKQETVPDYPLPWAMERTPLRCPPGFHESHDHLTSQ